MTIEQNEKLFQKMTWLENLYFFIFWLAIANTFYWSFLGAYYSKNLLYYGLLIMFLLIAIFEYAFNINKKSISLKRVRLTIGLAIGLGFSFFQYFGFMSLYFPKYKESIYNEVLERISHTNNPNMIEYNNELLKNVEYIIPSELYIRNVLFMSTNDYTIFMIMSFVISILTIWFVAKYIDNNQEIIEVFINTKQEQFKIRSKYKTKEYEEKKKNETIINSIKDLTDNLKK